MNFAADYLSHYAYSVHNVVHVLENPPTEQNSKEHTLMRRTKK